MKNPSNETWSEEIRNIFQRIVDEMVAVAPQGWTTLEWRTIVVGRHKQDGMYVIGDDGSREIVEPPHRRAMKLLVELRERSYRLGAGTWFTAVCTLTDQGGFDIAFDYDGEPVWNIAPPSPAYYAADLTRFPRDPENIPTWLADKLHQAATEDDQQ